MKLYDLSKTIYEQTYEYDNEGIDGTFKRIVKYIASNEKDSAKWEKEFYNILTGFKFVPGGRIISNAGLNKTNTSMINCFVSGFRGTHQDSMESILAELRRQALILKSEGGYGFNCDVLRPKGAFINGIANESPGPIEMLKMWDTQSNVITMGSGKFSNKKGAKKKIRKGAQMVTMSIENASVIDFIIAKQIPDTLTKFNMSVLITDDFMDAVINNKPWNLIFPDYETEFNGVSTKELYDNEWDGNFKKWINKGYPVKTYKTFENANELWDLIMKSTYNRNEPGVLFVDTINRMNNLYYDEYINATNPCFHPDTLIAAKQNNNKFQISIKELTDRFKNGESFEINSFNVKTHIYEYKQLLNAFLTKQNAELITINLSDGSNLQVTPDHKIYVINEQKEIIKKEAHTLLSTDELISPYNLKIVSLIKNNNHTDVYDITVQDNHNLLANNVLSCNCGEQPLPVNSVCNLGSINLTQFIKNNDWDYDKLKKIIPVAIRFMDNVSDLTYLPLDEQKEQIKKTRRVGLGVMGYASALMMMKIRYGSDKAIKKTDKLFSFIKNEAYKTSALLANEKGQFELFELNNFKKSYHYAHLSNDTQLLINKYGMRNSHLLTIAPNGNSGIFANNVTGGCEPIFLPEYKRTSTVSNIPIELNVPTKIDWNNKKIDNNDWSWIIEGDSDLLIREFNNETYKIDKSRGVLKESIVQDYAVRYLNEKNEYDENAEWNVNVSNLTIDDHVNTLNILSKHIDSAISKTINLPNNISYNDFKDVYLKVYNSGVIKGCTTYRDGTMTSVLSSINTTKSNKNIDRPETLQCDIHHLTAQGKKWIVLVGILNDKPYEVFAFRKKQVSLSPKFKTGNLIKVKSGIYNLDIPDVITFENIKDLFTHDEEEAMTRLISLILRNNAKSMEMVTGQLDKAEGSIVSFSKAISRTLKKYIKESNKTGKCPECGSDLKFTEGCVSCSQNCGFSKCS